ncbi:MAG TPA: cytochrome p460 [Nitratifractor sp.]|nr:cytochrome p460 [Nitratifractor sp.]
MKHITKIVSSILFLGTMAYAADVYLTDNSTVPSLVMKDTSLSFKEIEGYQNYKIVATHFRKDKNEIRYILANPIAYNAFKASKKIMPEGSKIVKIGWSVKDMSKFPSALEANKIERVEYMIKDARLHKESDGWGYARFVKKDGKYNAWGGDPKSCVACHASVKADDAVFTHFQRLF